MLSNTMTVGDMFRDIFQVRCGCQSELFMQLLLDMFMYQYVKVIYYLKVWLNIPWLFSLKCANSSINTANITTTIAATTSTSITAASPILTQCHRHIYYKALLKPSLIILHHLYVLTYRWHPGSRDQCKRSVPVIIFNHTKYCHLLIYNYLVENDLWIAEWCDCYHLDYLHFIMQIKFAGNQKRYLPVSSVITLSSYDHDFIPSFIFVAIWWSYIIIKFIIGSHVLSYRYQFLHFGSLAMDLWRTCTIKWILFVVSSV